MDTTHQIPRSPRVIYIRYDGIHFSFYPLLSPISPARQDHQASKQPTDHDSAPTISQQLGQLTNDQHSVQPPSTASKLQLFSGPHFTTVHLFEQQLVISEPARLLGNYQHPRTRDQHPRTRELSAPRNSGPAPTNSTAHVCSCTNCSPQFLSHSLGSFTGAQILHENTARG